MTRDWIWLDTRRATMGTITLAVAEEWSLSVELLLSRRRTAAVAWPRQVAMYLCALDGSRSLPMVGRFFHRDHTTVMHAQSRVEMMMAKSKTEARRIELLIARLHLAQDDECVARPAGTVRFDGAQPMERA